MAAEEEAEGVVSMSSSCGVGANIFGLKRMFVWVQTHLRRSYRGRSFRTIEGPFCGEHTGRVRGGYFSKSSKITSLLFDDQKQLLAESDENQPRKFRSGDIEDVVRRNKASLGYYLGSFLHEVLIITRKTLHELVEEQFPFIKLSLFLFLGAPTFP